MRKNRQPSSSLKDAQPFGAKTRAVGDQVGQECRELLGELVAAVRRRVTVLMQGDVEDERIAQGIAGCARLLRTIALKAEAGRFDATARRLRGRQGYWSRAHEEHATRILGRQRGESVEGIVGRGWSAQHEAILQRIHGRQRPKSGEGGD